MYPAPGRAPREKPKRSQFLTTLPVVNNEAVHGEAVAETLIVALAAVALAAMDPDKAWLEMAIIFKASLIPLILTSD